MYIWACREWGSVCLYSTLSAAVCAELSNCLGEKQPLFAFASVAGERLSRVTFSPHVACVIPLRRHALLNRSCSCTCHVFVLGIVLVTGSTAAKWRHYMHEVWDSPRLCPRSDQAAVCAWHRERTSPIFCYPLLELQSQPSAQQPTRTPQDDSLGATGRLEAPMVKRHPQSSAAPSIPRPPVAPGLPTLAPPGRGDGIGAAWRSSCSTGSPSEGFVGR